MQSSVLFLYGNLCHSSFPSHAALVDPSYPQIPNLSAQLTTSKPSHSLDGGGVLDWNNGLWNVILHRDGAGLTWHQWLALQVDVGSVDLGLGLEGSVGLDTADELLAGAGEGDVLNAEVDALLDVAVLDLLVDDDTDGGLGNVVDDTSLSVVNLVWHTMAEISMLSLGARSGSLMICGRLSGRFIPVPEYD